jgi:hypothetical protein
MKKVILIFIVLIISSTIQGQAFFIPFVNINNGNAQLANTSYHWSFGETTLINTLVNQNGLIITGGLLQPFVNSSYTLSSSSINELKLLIGPNPVNNNINLYCNQLNIFIERIQVTDAFGQLKQIFNGPFSAVNFKLQIPFLSANTGIYFIVIHYIVGNKLYNTKTYKIVKA